MTKAIPRSLHLHLRSLKNSTIMSTPLQRKQSEARWDLNSEEVLDSLDNVATLMLLPCCVMDFLAFKKPFLSLNSVLDGSK